MRSAPLSLLWLFACGEKPGLNVNNDAPELSIISPTDNSEYNEYTLIEFVARATDLEDEETSLDVTWSSNLDDIIDTSQPDEDGNIYFAIDTLTPGDHIITLTVTDSQGLSGNTAVSLTIEDQPDAPTIDVRLPTTSTGEEGVPIVFEALVEDVQDGPEDLLVSFASDVDGEFCNPSIDEVGIASCESTLSVGEHLLLFAVVDTHEFITEHTMSFTILPGTQIDNDLDGFTEEQGDCDDTLSTISPNGVEVPNDVDDDCDGTIDEETDVYDDDGDGFAELDGDCNDADATIYPDANEDCDGIDQDCDGVIDNDTICFDDDGDGFTEEDGDCDDAETDAYPNNTEVADGIDNDCDTFVDEGTPFFDDDGDCFCEQTPCYGSSNGACTVAIDSDGDCDDTVDTIYIGAPEYCNAIDDDCNGIADNSAVDALTWYYDDDGDNYGNPNQSAMSCSQPNNYVSNSNDCNDSNPYAWSGNTESCDGHDNDCDGSIDENVLNTFYLDYDNDGYGSATSTTESCTLPVGYVANSDDCNDNCSTCHPGRNEVCDGVDNDCDGTSDEQNTSDCSIYYQDIDDDYYGTSASICACSPTGDYTATLSGDCFDDGINADITHPGNYYETSSSPRGDDGTYDFDCDGTVEKQYTDVADCSAYPFDGTSSNCDNGWFDTTLGVPWGSVESCGDTSTYSTSCSSGSYSCNYSTVQRTQGCR